MTTENQIYAPHHYLPQPLPNFLQKSLYKIEYFILIKSTNKNPHPSPAVEKHCHRLPVCGRSFFPMNFLMSVHQIIISPFHACTFNMFLFHCIKSFSIKLKLNILIYLSFFTAVSVFNLSIGENVTFESPGYPDFIYSIRPVILTWAFNAVDNSRLILDVLHLQMNDLDTFIFGLGLDPQDNSTIVYEVCINIYIFSPSYIPIKFLSIGNSNNINAFFT